MSSFFGALYSSLRKKNLHGYDVVVDVKSLLELGTGNWAVKYPILEAAEDVTTALAPAQGATVAVLGLYNRGKTWIISQLCGITLDHSYFTHTEGISFTIPTNDLGKNMLFIDTAGAQRPVKSGPGVIERRHDAKATEAYLRTLAFQLANTVLLVVNRLTLDDEIYLDELKQRLEKLHRKSSELIVIHNWTHVRTSAQMQTVIEDELLDALCLKEEIFMFPDRDSHKFYRHSDGTRHVVFAEERSEAAKKWNERSVKMLHTVLQASASSQKRPFDLLREITDYSNLVLSSFFTTKVTVKANVDRASKRVTSIQRVGSAEKLTYRPAKYNQIGGFEVDGAGSAKATIIDYADRYEVIIDAPGMKEDDSAEIDIVTEKIIHVTMQKPVEKYGGAIIMDERRVHGPSHLVRREFEFPQALDRSKGEWEIRNGQLKIVVTKLGAVVKLGRKMPPVVEDDRSGKRVKADVVEKK